MKKLLEKLGGGGASKDAVNTLVGKTVVVGAYTVRVESLVGEGGLATVYRAVSVANGQPFALKHLRLMADSDAIKDVQMESKHMAKFKGHPNIVQLHSVAFAGPSGAETDGFMLLEYCPGTLLELMQRSNFNLDDLTVFTVFSEVCNAVAHMHRQNPPVAHRDLKAENVLRNAEGRWVLADFGSATTRAQVYETQAEIAAEEENIRRNTTPAYRAPEMWDLYTRQRIDCKADIWALGVLLYVLMFGKLPFAGDAKLSIVFGKYTIPPGRSQALCNLIREMLVVNPTERPDIFRVLSMLEEVRVSLTAQLVGGAPAQPLGTSPRPAGLLQRTSVSKPVATAPGAGAAAAVATAPAASTAPAVPKPPAAAAPEPAITTLIDVTSSPAPTSMPAAAADQHHGTASALSNNPFGQTFDPDWGDQPAFGAAPQVSPSPSGSAALPAPVSTTTGPLHSSQGGVPPPVPPSTSTPSPQLQSSSGPAGNLSSAGVAPAALVMQQQQVPIKAAVLPAAPSSSQFTQQQSPALTTVSVPVASAAAHGPAGPRSGSFSVQHAASSTAQASAFATNSNNPGAAAAQQVLASLQPRNSDASPASTPFNSTPSHSRTNSRSDVLDLWNVAAAANPSATPHTSELEALKAQVHLLSLNQQTLMQRVKGLDDKVAQQAAVIHRLQAELAAVQQQRGTTPAGAGPPLAGAGSSLISLDERTAAAGNWSFDAGPPDAATGKPAATSAGGGSFWAAP